MEGKNQPWKAVGPMEGKRGNGRKEPTMESGRTDEGWEPPQGGKGSNERKEPTMESGREGWEPLREGGKQWKERTDHGKR